MELLGVEDAMVQRYVNQGFSGGEKKKNEVLQLAVLEPQIAILDETDSGLDIDSLKSVADGCATSWSGPTLGRAAHHALPAHPELHHARPHPRDDERSDRDVRRRRSSRTSSSSKGYEGLRDELGVEADATAES